MSLWPATVSSVCLCCPGASPTNTTSFLKWLIPEKGSTRSRPPSSSTNDGSTWANTDAALKEINAWIFWAHTQSHKLIPTLSHYIIVIINGTIFWHSLSFSVVAQQGRHRTARYCLEDVEQHTFSSINALNPSHISNLTLPDCVRWADSFDVLLSLMKAKLEGTLVLLCNHF